MNRDILKEKVIHGDILFPLSTYFLSYENLYNIVDCHWHDEVEFLMVTKGKAIFQVETDSYEVAPGQAIYIQSGEIHTGYSINSSACSFCAIVFNPDILISHNIDDVQRKFIDPLIKKQFSFPFHIKGINEWEKKVLVGLVEIARLFKIQPYTYELTIKANLYLILSEIIVNASIIAPGKVNNSNSYKTERLKTVLNYIHENYEKKIEIKDLALTANMSEGYFYRFFRQMTKRTPVDFINQYRIDKATILLRESDKKIFEIAMDVGFDNFSYFIGIFKKYFKCTPLEYRKSN